MRAHEAVKFSNIAATTAAFTLTGGHYWIGAKATGFGTVGLQTLLPDGTTFVASHTAFSADGFTTAFLPPGTYKFVIATATAVYAGVVRIPYE